MTTNTEFSSLLRLAAMADYSRAFAVGAAASLRLADAFCETRSVDVVAAERGLDARTLRRLLRALVAFGLFTEPEPGTFATLPAARLLLDAHPWSLRGAYSPLHADVRAWARIGHSLRSGSSAFELTHGESFWKYLSKHPSERALFDRSMEELSRLESLWLPGAYDWPRFQSIVDVGGGRGSTLVALLRAFPAIRGVLFELPTVAEQARSLIAAAGLSERCTVEDGDFFLRVPEGHDAYILKRIIYSYDDPEALRILQQVRSAMRDDSRVLLLEPVRRRSSGFDYGKLLDMQMLMLGGGRVRDRKALRELLAAARLRLGRLIPTAMTTIVEAMPE